jgi:hypothetical protein
LIGRVSEREKERERERDRERERESSNIIYREQPWIWIANPSVFDALKVIHHSCRFPGRTLRSRHGGRSCHVRSCRQLAGMDSVS